MAQRSECDQQRTRKRRQRRIRAFDEDAAVTGGRRRTSEVEPVRGRASSHDQPRSAAWERIKNVFPGYGVAAAPVGNREHEIPGWIDGGDDERVFGARNRRHHVSAHNGLKRRHDARRTWRTAVVDRIPAVPARSTGAHLCDPRPHPFRWCVNRDRVGRREDWLGNHRVDRKRTALFESRGNAGRGHHDALEGAFAVPASLTVRSGEFERKLCRCHGTQCRSSAENPPLLRILSPTASSNSPANRPASSD